MKFAAAKRAIMRKTPRRCRLRAWFFAVMTAIGFLPALIALGVAVYGLIAGQWALLILLIPGCLSLQYPAFTWVTRNRTLRQIETRSRLLSRVSM
ncbi:MAG: hypothetical protein AAGF84_06985 [Planctomycetota bacterium]